MNRDQWMKAARQLYDTMLTTAQAEAPALVSVIELHRPKRAPNRGLPVCHGCDKAYSDLPDAEWACRTFEILAKVLLDITSVDDELQRRHRADLTLGRHDGQAEARRRSRARSSKAG